jgi:predicted nuclease of predicted toxin-antitoxin system
VKLLVDMNLSPRWVELLAKNNFEVLHWTTAGDARALDVEIMAYAARHDFVVLTNDLDFGAILAATHARKPSVVQIRSDNLNPDVIGRQVIDALRQMENELQVGALMTVEPQRTRLRVLPLAPEQ